MEQVNERLIAAAQDGDAQTLRALLDASADVNTKGYSGMTALMHASRNNHIECVKILLNVGADVNTVNELGRTALRMAAERGYPEIIKLLQDAGAVDKPKDITNDQTKQPSISWPKDLPERIIHTLFSPFIWVGILIFLHYISDDPIFHGNYGNYYSREPHQWLCALVIMGLPVGRLFRISFGYLIPSFLFFLLFIARFTGLGRLNEIFVVAIFAAIGYYSGYFLARYLVKGFRMLRSTE